MEHSVREEAGALVVYFSGEVDLEHSPAARKVLLDCVGRSSKVLVDLSGVEYIDSSGVASLVEAFQKAKKSGVEFALVSVNDSARRVLELTRLDKVFTIHDTLAEGLRT
ncbi:MAG: STAS domain-containing protein [Myxococcota bacterium]|jgi:anti-sigma B factor antagonist|nr:STAS domain-containing protein [bacterium]MDP6074528.1 STAS domain-containing protein [Myxococcota bacterium]MDP7073913.1 STAS domain-containing protein [Myxococcota bacterium]MDP7300426.1 STAS domain-containing protein [Myxococcota bacterium]MDP7433294.1 STAS domain-containing protein [Myxococcota bacterium]|tara:strand:- start:127 stop:453 length:327 start_codon:yes stop_codon:yes gene_type:complete